MAKKPVRIRVRYGGHVQGVGFRMTAVQQVKSSPITGWVRNDPDGGVTLEAQGDHDVLLAFLSRVDEALGHRISDQFREWIPAVEETGPFRVRS